MIGRCGCSSAGRRRRCAARPVAERVPRGETPATRVTRCTARPVSNDVRCTLDEIMARAEERDRSPSLPVRLAISWATNAVVLAIVAGVLEGVHVSSAGSLIAAAAVFGVLNTILKPLLRLVTLPLAILTLGIAWCFVSLLMLVITRDIVGGFHIYGFWTLVEATLIVWIVNLVLDFTPGPWQVTGHRRRRREVRRHSAKSG
jgi:putative membrane protein